MRDYINIGCSPHGETCAQIQDEDFGRRSRTECAAFIEEIRNKIGPEKGTAQLSVKSFNHDFGTYREVVCFYDDNDEVGMDYAFEAERADIEVWTEVGREILNRQEVS